MAVNKYISQGVKCELDFKVFFKQTGPSLKCEKCNGEGRGNTKMGGTWECDQCAGSGIIYWIPPPVPEYLQHHMLKAWNAYWKAEQEARP